MDNWALCKPSWQRSGPKREMTERGKTTRPCCKSSIFHCFKWLDPPPLSLSSPGSGNFQNDTSTASSLPDLHKTPNLPESPPSFPRLAPKTSLLFLVEEAKLDRTSTSGSSSTSVKFLAASQMYTKLRWERRGGRVEVYISACAGAGMRGGFHARVSLERFPAPASLSVFWQRLWMEFRGAPVAQWTVFSQHCRFKSRPLTFWMSSPPLSFPGCA